MPINTTMEMANHEQQSQPMTNGRHKSNGNCNGNDTFASGPAIELPLVASQPLKEAMVNGMCITENGIFPGDTSSQNTPADPSIKSANTGTGGIGGATAALAAADERSDISSIGSGTAGSMGEGSGGGGLKPSNRNSGLHRRGTSAIGLDSMIDNRREEGGLTANVVHMEVPFGKPIEEVYDGVQTGPVMGSGISGVVRLVTHKATGVKYAVKCLDLGLVDTQEGLMQLR